MSAKETDYLISREAMDFEVQMDRRLSHLYGIELDLIFSPHKRLATLDDAKACYLRALAKLAKEIQDQGATS